LSILIVDKEKLDPFIKVFANDCLEPRDLKVCSLIYQPLKAVHN